MIYIFTVVIWDKPYDSEPRWDKSVEQFQDSFYAETNIVYGGSCTYNLIGILLMNQCYHRF